MEKREARKMAAIRTPFQGVYNILRFNWHLYLLNAILIIILSSINYSQNNVFNLTRLALILILSATALSSLLVSFYLYDLSGFYELEWLEEMSIPVSGTVVNLNAGFDEISGLLIDKYPGIELTVCDFYIPGKHTEISIKRARKAYPPHHGTIQIDSSKILLPDDYADIVFLIFAAHEIRDKEERTSFFKEIKRLLKANGKIIVVEHLRDKINFLAYNIGFLHFISKSDWYQTFNYLEFRATEEKITPFVTNFILEKNGIKP